MDNQVIKFIYFHLYVCYDCVRLVAVPVVEYIPAKDGKLVCNACFKVCQSLSQMEAHLNSAHREPRFGCLHCNYRTRQKNNLKRHYKTLHKMDGTAFDALAAAYFK